ncbi:MAG TPA: TIGR01244 family sulfur transferase [Stellaceae bacterium]|nr:TIGR01244 family sulfur transferase [Stellaceae bacterium]
MPPTPITDQLSVSGQITREDIAAFAKEGYGTIINNRPDGEEPGQLTNEEAAAEAAKHGLEYRYIPIVTNTMTRRDVVAHQHAVLRGRQKVLAYCRSGTRCYLLWAANRVLYEGESAVKIVAEAALKGYDLRVLPRLIEKLEAEPAP